MLSDAGRAVAHRRRDIQSSNSFVAPLLLLWFLVWLLTSTNSYSHPILLPPFDAIVSSPASHYCLPLRPSKTARAPICLYSSQSENCLKKSHRSVKSITFPGFFRRNFANLIVDGPTSTPQLPATTIPTQIFSSPPSSRRTINTNPSIEKSLGFPFLDPSFSGPLLSLSQPICEIYGPTSLFNWSRYALYNPLFSPLHCLLRLINWNGRRHLFNLVSTSLQWLSYYHDRTWFQTSSRVVTANCKHSLEENSHWISLTAGYNLGPLLASFPVRMSRTHGNSFFWMDLSLFEKFSTLESMKLFSTSQCLLIRTIHHLLELIANVVSTYLSLACDLVLFCSRLRVLLDLLSNYLSFIFEFHYAIISFVVSSLNLAKTLCSVIFVPSG